MPLLPGVLWMQEASVLFDSSLINRDRIALFQCPVGSTDHGVVKLWKDTNMVMHAMLPVPRQFKIQRMYCLILDAGRHPIPLTESHLWADTKLSLEISTRGFLDGPAWIFAHPNIVFAGLDHKERERKRQEWLRFQGPDLEIPILPAQYFKVQVECAAPEPDDTLIVMLQGTLTREII